MVIHTFLPAEFILRSCGPHHEQFGTSVAQSQRAWAGIKAPKTQNHDPPSPQIAKAIGGATRLERRISERTDIEKIHRAEPFSNQQTNSSLKDNIGS
jgi:hypothetical protein